MLKIYDVIDYVSINKQDWRAVGTNGFFCTDEDRDSKLILDNVSFSEAHEYLENNRLDGLKSDYTVWRPRPTVCVRYQDAFDVAVYSKFSAISYKRVYKENKDATLKWLMNHLSADQFIQYLKERGITTCPMNF